MKFKDLEEVVSHKISVNLMPFDVRTDFVRVTSDTVLVPITIQVKNRDVTFVNKDGVQRGTVNIFGRVTTLTGKIVQTFEDTVQVDVPAELLPKVTENSSVYWKALPLRPNLYRIDVAVKDVNGDRSGLWSSRLPVPSFDDDRLSSSSLIVADTMAPVSTKEIGTGHVCDRQYQDPAARGVGQWQAGIVQAQSESLFLDAGLQSWRGRQDAQALGHGRVRCDQRGHQQGSDSYGGIHGPDGQYWRPGDPGKTSLGRQS